MEFRLLQFIQKKRFSNGSCQMKTSLTLCYKDYLLTASFKDFPTLNCAMRFASSRNFWPVIGLRPSLAARSFTSNVPKPTRDTFSPLTSVSVTTSVKASTALPASFLEIPAFSATAATKSTLFISIPPDSFSRYTWYFTCFYRKSQDLASLS